MDQLLKITTIPMKYELKIESAHLEYGNSRAFLDVHRERGGLSMKSTMARLNIDTFEARASVVPTAFISVRDSARAGQEASEAAAARYAREGHMMVSSTNDGNTVLNQIFAGRLDMPAGDFRLAFLPSAAPQFHYQPGDLSMNYEIDRLKFDFRQQKGTFQFVPGSVEMDTLQRPSVEIEYIGEPVYIPPSSAPGYKPVDLKA